jgi:hypothetical protein
MQKIVGQTRSAKKEKKKDTKSSGGRQLDRKTDFVARDLHLARC